MNNNPYDDVLTILDIADGYYQRVGVLDDKNRYLRDLFYMLVLLELVVDKQRVLVKPGSSFGNHEELKEVNRRLDDLREKIIEIRNRIGKVQARTVLESLGESVKVSYM